MSSFEPLFADPVRTRITPRLITTVRRDDLWMPAHVSAPVMREQAIFTADLSDMCPTRANDDAAAQMAAADAETARVAALDAAYLRGVSEGREQGEQAERARLRGAMMAAESALDDVRSGESRWLSNVEENIAAIAVAVAQQVVAREVATGTDVVLGIVTRAVQEFGLDQALTIRVNPNDLTSLQSVERDSSPEMVSLTRGREVRWSSDARIEPGGCVVEGRERIVDGRVDTGLERLYRRLTYTHA